MMKNIAIAILIIAIITSLMFYNKSIFINNIDENAEIINEILFQSDSMQFISFDSILFNEIFNKNGFITGSICFAYSYDSNGILINSDCTDCTSFSTC